MSMGSNGDDEGTLRKRRESDPQSSSDESTNLEHALDRLSECRANENAGDMIRRTIAEEVREWKIMTHAALPDWLKDNDFLHGGHRPPIPCMATCFKSVFSMHSETVNIWTHLLGSLIIVAITLYYFIHPESVKYSWPRVVVFLLFFLSAVLCLTFSWLYHTVYCHSVQMNKLFSKLDYSGISVLIFGSFVPWLYYSFYCQMEHMILYTCVLVVLSIACIIFSLTDEFSKPNWRPLRASMFVCLGLSGVVPVAHGVATHGVHHTKLSHMLLVASLYITGALIYALRIPERFLPGKLDIWGHSHQLFHILIVVAAVIHYQGINIMAEDRKDLGECSVSEQTSSNVFPIFA